MISDFLKSLSNQDWISVINTLLVILTILYASKQYKRTKVTDSSNTLLRTIEFLQNKEFISARRHVHTKLQNKEYSKWNAEDIDFAETVCRNFDTACLMNEILKYPENIKVISIKWNHSIKRSYEICKPMINAYKQERGSGFWNHFDKLNEEAIKNNTDNTDFKLI